MYQCDVTCDESIKNLHDKVIKVHPNLNIVVNNAGIMMPLNLLDFTDVTSEIETNLNGTIKMSQMFLKRLLKFDESAIINISLGLAFIPYKEAPMYSVSKAGVHMYTKVLRKQLKTTPIKVFEVAQPKTTKAMINKQKT